MDRKSAVPSWGRCLGPSRNTRVPASQSSFPVHFVASVPFSLTVCHTHNSVQVNWFLVTYFLLLISSFLDQKILWIWVLELWGESSSTSKFKSDIYASSWMYAMAMPVCGFWWLSWVDTLVNPYFHHSIGYLRSILRLSPLLQWRDFRFNSDTISRPSRT